MATLVSAGVDVSIVNDSIYGPAGSGTVPLIIFATAANKVAGSGIGVAPYTTAAEAGKLKLLTSQRDVALNYGNPSFYSYQGTPLHGHELNEYGLLTLNQALGFTGPAYGLRADIDTAALIPSDTAPVGAPVPGTFWLDTSTSRFGIFISNGNPNVGQAWERITPLFPAINQVQTNGNGELAPLPTYGAIGDYALVTHTNNNLLFVNDAGLGWIRVGAPAWQALHSAEVVSRSIDPSITASLSLTINDTLITVTAPATIDDVVEAINIEADANPFGVVAFGGENDTIILGATEASFDIHLVGEDWLRIGFREGLYRAGHVHYTFDASFPADSTEGNIWIKGTSPAFGTDLTLKVYTSAGAWQKVPVTAVDFDDISYPDEMGNLNSAGNVVLATNTMTGSRALYRYAAGAWSSLSYEAGAIEPVGKTPAGALWYSTDYAVDIMVNDGRNWRGYREIYPTTDIQGVMLSGSAPTFQSDGGSLVENDLWIDTTDTENYPALRRYNGTRWVAVDLTDQTTPNGIVFGDARGAANSYDSYNSGGEFDPDGNPMLKSSFVDPDAPNPQHYPNDMLLFNTRYSTYNVKRWEPNYFKEGGFDPNTDYTRANYHVGDTRFTMHALADAGRWVTASGNQADGRPYMGRKAQRVMITRAMAAAIVANDELISEAVKFNLIAAPGYPELLEEMIDLNVRMKEIAFVVGDTPARLAPNAIETWATNRLNAIGTGDEGLTAASPFAGIYYPWGLSKNVDGSDVMVPPSTLALRVIAYNDQVSYPWKAPAGFNRGLVQNASSVGYLNAEEEYTPVVLNLPQRNTLYQNRINPIANMPERGLAVYGQKTLAPVASAIDRINVARLASYIKYHLDLIVEPFLFESNTRQTRDAAKTTVERFYNGLLALEAIEDYGVQCDLDNNTGERRNRNELWIDSAFIPVKAIEFIYAPVRINTSQD